MAVGIVAREIADLCIGKPGINSVQPSVTVRQVVLLLKRCEQNYLTVWSEKSTLDGAATRCLGTVSMADIVCYLCADENLTAPVAALDSPVSVLLGKDSSAQIVRVERHFSVLDGLDLILSGAQNLLVPRKAQTPSRSKTPKEALAYCLIAQEDFIRFFLNSIGVFSPIPTFSLDSLGIIQTEILAVEYHEPAISAVPLLRLATAAQTAVAITTEDGKLIGEISPSTLAICDGSVAAAISTLSAGDLMAYIDSVGPSGPPEEAIRAVKARLAARAMSGMLDLMDDASSLNAYSSSSSSDEESPACKGIKYSAKMGRRSEDAIVCHPWSSLVAVMIQALAHRVSHVWVVEDDFQLAGVVTFADMLGVFREQLLPVEPLQ